MSTVLVPHHICQIVSLASQLIYSFIAVEWQQGFPAVYIEEPLK